MQQLDLFAAMEQQQTERAPLFKKGDYCRIVPSEWAVDCIPHLLKKRVMIMGFENESSYAPLGVRIAHGEESTLLYLHEITPEEE